MLELGVAAVAAGRIFLHELDRLAAANQSFGFETTLSGRSHAARMAQWKRAGYRVEMIYLSIDSPDIALKRIAARVKQGGHDVPRTDVLRRFGRSRKNFEETYRALADAWAVFDNSGAEPVLLEQRPVKPRRAARQLEPDEFSRGVGRALRRAGRRARETARMHGTPIYVLKNGKLVAIKP